jgi:hypothetical protein
MGDNCGDALSGGAVGQQRVSKPSHSPAARPPRLSRATNANHTCKQPATVDRRSLPQQREEKRGRNLEKLRGAGPICARNG